MLISDACKIEGDHTDGSGHFCRSKEPVPSLEEFSKIELEPTTHGPDGSGSVGILVSHLFVGAVRFFHAFILRTDEILKIRKSVFCRHLKEGVNIRIVPREILGDIIRWDRKGEYSSFLVSRGIDLDECLIDKSPFPIELFKCFLVFSARVSTKIERLVLEVLWTCPIEGNIRKWCLGSPP